MSRRGGKRRQVLQLGDTSKLHRYGYSKGFQTVESSVQSNSLTGLVGDYSDSDSDDNSNSEAKLVNPVLDKDEQYDVTTPPVQEPSSNEHNGGSEDPMDNELRNFLSEIEAIPMPDESKTPEHISDGGASPAPEDNPKDADIDDSQSSNKLIQSVAGPSKKKSNYSMFVKGDVEFAHSPSPTPPPSNADQVNEDSQENSKSVNPTDGGAEPNFDDIPEEPTTRWQMVQDEATQYYYYWNWQTNQVTWEIPTDYTQYLLLHKEYEEKIAKIPPHVLQAWKDKKAGKDSGADADIKSKETAHLAPVASSHTSTKTHPSGKEEVDNDNQDTHRHSHHKKKKSKKHKRRRDSSSDGDDLDSKYLREESSSVKSSSMKIKKTKAAIGPQPLSIVPYLSDDNDEDSCDNDDDEKLDDKKEKEIISETLSNLNSSSALDKQIVKSRSASVSPVPELPSKRSSNTEAKQADFDSLVQNLVEFHDNMILPGDDTKKDLSPASKNTKESNLDIGGVVADTDESKNGALKENGGKEEKMEIMIKNEIESVADVQDSINQEADTHSNERQNIFDQFSVIKEAEKKIKKKKVINMFAEDSESEKDENVDGKDKDNSSKVLNTPVAMEVDESVSSNDSIEKKEKKQHSNSDTKSSTQTSENQSPMLNNIVGYSEDDKKDEGGLKEDEKVKETTASIDAGSNQPKKKVLQYKDYMKKYRSDKTTMKGDEDSEKEINTSSTATSVHSEESVKSQEEQVALKEESEVQSDVINEEEKVVKEVAEEKVEEEEEDDDDLEEDIDLDDLDNIDRVLEKALKKKKVNKTENKPEADGKIDELPETSQKASNSSVTQDDKAEEKKRSELVEPSGDSSTLSDTDMKRLKYSVKDSAELALNKLQFLDISTKNLSKLQVLLVELQTRYNDWQSGGLSTTYFHSQLKSSEALLSQYEESAVPKGWLCEWDRASCRYFYRNQQSGHTQWEYPQTTAKGGGGVGAEHTSTASSKTADPKDTSATITTTTSSSSRGRSSKKRRSKDTEEREETSSKSRGHNSSSRSSRSHRSSKKGSEKDRGKRDRHSSSSHHHRKKKRRRRDHSSSSSSSEEESGHSRHRHRSKRKKRGRSDKSPSLEVIGSEDPEPVQIEDSPPHPPTGDSREDKTGLNGGDENSIKPISGTLSLIADYDSEQDPDEQEKENGDDKDRNIQSGSRDDSSDKVLGLDESSIDDVRELERKKKEMEAELEGIDGEEMEDEDDEEGMHGEEETTKGEQEEEDLNTAVIIKPPQIIVPPYVAAMNQPQLYSTPALYTSAPVSASTTMAPPVSADQSSEQGDATTLTANTSQASEDSEKVAKKKKKKDKSGKEKSLAAKKRVSSMVQKWQQVKKEVEKENRDKELRQAAIREKINQLKST